MIYDSLKNIESYKGISRNLDTAIDFLVKTDLNTLPEGWTDIDGEHVFANVISAVTHELTEESFEIHRNYMDIQIDLQGTEVIGTGQVHHLHGGRGACPRRMSRETGNH